MRETLFDEIQDVLIHYFWKKCKKTIGKNVVKIDEIDGKTGCSNEKLRKFMFTICKTIDHHITIK